MKSFDTSDCVTACERVGENIRYTLETLITEQLREKEILPGPVIVVFAGEEFFGGHTHPSWYSGGNGGARHGSGSGLTSELL